MIKYWKEFILYPDISFMLILFTFLFIFIIPQIFQWEAWLAILIGMIVYTISEYFIHRFLFHIRTPSHPLFLKLIRRLHYDHHVDPTNLKLLFLPLWFSIPNFLLLTFITYSITKDKYITGAFATGLVGYFLYYEWKHYIAHKPIQPSTALGKKLKKVHLWHHYKNENYWFGVTHSSIDKTMGTYRNHKEVEKSATAKNLEKRV
ncbi:sterol desaturase family protein [Virgibacillus halodenitrificans]|uniref:sterol desaturase family protein n=1 Tax=Virgibacillus halodenitrificans TaxID=1482 RepID=UPI001F2329F2|nr:sterol desaturase family protein [Virgibacillus halodenitrificans]MCG1029913.1 sterol desaturase family protein [Virgibacillus halodenitrificans]MCJ0930038.1 sterol desaturase family protein [Virgibacillus halodenitrificans]MEC2158318.1 sterol desaturase family protein [Virgibacillus halodenitrificans]